MVSLSKAEAHHARDVLRLTDGTRVEVFDDAGTVGEGMLTIAGADVAVRVERADLALLAAAAVRLTIAAAVPKGDRADWMIEKLSELGVSEFIPLAAARSVVLPEGKGKRDRWLRIATEAAKQSRRVGVMRITELATVAKALGRVAADGGRMWFLSTETEQRTPVAAAVAGVTAGAPVTAFVGPEGGWTQQELRQFLDAGAAPVQLTSTILRIETAAVTTAAAVMCFATGGAAGRAAAKSLDAPAAHEDDPPAGTASRTRTTP